MALLLMTRVGRSGRPPSSNVREFVDETDPPRIREH